MDTLYIITQIAGDFENASVQRVLDLIEDHQEISCDDTIITMVCDILRDETRA